MMLGQAAGPSWTFILLGVAAGILSGTLGVGSGTLLIPALVLIYYLPQKSAQGITLAVMVPMALVAAIRYKLNPAISVPFSIVALIALGAVGGAFVGAELAHYLPGSVLRKCFAIFIIVVGVRMLLVTPRPAGLPQEKAVSAVQVEQDGGGKENSRGTE